MENNKKDNGNTGYLLSAGMIFFGILLYLLFTHWVANSLAFFLYVLGLLSLVQEFGGKNNKRGMAFLIAGIGFLILTLTFVNSEFIIYEVIFAILLTVTFLIFLGGIIESHQSKNNAKIDVAGKEKQNKKFNKPYNIALEILNAVGSMLSIILFIYEFFL